MTTQLKIDIPTGIYEFILTPKATEMSSANSSKASTPFFRHGKDDLL